MAALVGALAESALIRFLIRLFFASRADMGRSSGWRTRVRGIALWIGIPLLLLAGAYLTWWLTLANRFEGRLRQLREAGEPARVTNLVQPPVPESQNGARYLLDAHAWYTRFKEQGGEPDCLLWCRSEWTDDDWSAAAEYVRACAPFVQLLKDGVIQPAYRLEVAWEEGPGAELPTMPLAQEAAQVLEVLALLNAKEPHGHTRAVQSLLLMLDVADRQERFPALPYFVRLTVYGIVVETMERVLAQPDFVARDVRRLMEPRLAAAEDLVAFTDALHGVRAMGIWAVERLLAGEALTCGEEESDTLRSLAPFVYQDGLRLLDLFDEVIPLASEPYPQARSRLASLVKDAEALKPKFPVTRTAAGKLCHNFDFRTLIMAETRLARVGLALLEHKQETGAWPTGLSDLRSRFDGPVPRNPFTGKHLTYERNDGGVRLLADAPLSEDERGSRDLNWEIAVH